MKLLAADQEIRNYLKDLKGRKINSFMCANRDEEFHYVDHNKDRFIVAIKEFDKLISAYPNKNPKVLDIGTSPFTFIIKKRYPQIKLYSIDYSKNFEKLCKKEGVTFKQVDLNDPKATFPARGFDFITFLEVIEHLSGNHKKVIDKVVESLKVGGYCILQTPNVRSLKSLMLKVMSLGKWDYLSDRPDLSPEFAHVKEYSLQELADLVSKQKSIAILKSQHSLYFDTVDSALVYRKYKRLFKPILTIHYTTVKIIPPLRRGLLLVFQKTK